MRHPWHRTDLPWADALLDTRSPEHLTDLPDTLPAPVQNRTIAVDGWTISPHTIPAPSLSMTTGTKPTSLSVLVMEAPDGWRGAVVLAQFSGTGFAFGGLHRALPYLARLLSPGKTGPDRRRLLRSLAAEAFPMLRGAMNDPFSWNPSGTALDHYDPGDLNIHLLRWASAGVRCEDASMLDSYEVRPHDPVRSRRTDLLAWIEAGFTDPHEVATWYEVGWHRPAEAKALSRLGFTAAVAREWMDTPVPPTNDPQVTWAFLDAGWTPRALRAIGARVNRGDPAIRYSFYGLVDCWTKRHHPRDASLMLEAGMSHGEAAQYTPDTIPDRDGLRLLAGLQQEPENWQGPFLGARKSPYYQGSLISSTG